MRRREFLQVAAQSPLAVAQGQTPARKGRLKQGIWAHHLIEALSGQAPLALENGRLLTAGSLRDYLSEEVPRTLRKTFEDARTQTPTLYGKPGREFVVADVGRPI